MEEKSNRSGTSLLVPSVQELAKGNTLMIPTRYIQYPHEELVIDEDDYSIIEIPIIDMKKLLSSEFKNSELSKLHLACKDWGFFQLVNHGVSSSLVEKVKLETQDFFNLPMSEKKKFWQTPQHMEGFGQAFVMSDEQKLDWADIFFMTTLPKHSRMPHLFPKLPLPIRDTFELYSMELEKLSKVIVEYMGKALNMKEMEMREKSYWPHTLQLNDVQGLQVRKDGMWVPVKPLPNAFIINIGDILEIITNGIYRSIEHRATVNSKNERISIATFYTTKHDGEIGPAKSLINEETPAHFKRLGLKEYLKNMFATKLDGKSFVDALRI
ncbi:hypothetical protein P8452_56417 [Trifolium repens]|nr:hypothetical protein P8452_56417 [Trifolium repens]